MINWFVLWSALWVMLYGPGAWWPLFAAIAYLTARYGCWWCVPVGHCLVGAILLVLDSIWDAEMQRSLPPGSPDREFPALGILFHVLLVNTLLLPVTWLGGRGRKPCPPPRPKQYDVLP